MNNIVLVFSWVVWIFFFLLGVGLLCSQSREGSLRKMSRTQGFILQIGCFATALFPFSKFHLIWWFFVAFLTPIILVQIRGNSIQGKIAKLQEESEITGVPFIELLQRENEKMEQRDQ